MIWKDIIIIIALVIISLFIFYAIKAYVLPKVKIKKGYVLCLAVIFIFSPLYLGQLYKYPIVQYIVMLAVSLTILIYFELVRMDMEKKKMKNMPVIGRPKPKKNRIDTTDDKK